MKIKKVPINSTNIRSVGYDPESLILEVEFHTDRVYRFSNVPPHIYAGLMKAESHGKYFQTHISGMFSHVEVK